MSYRTSARGRIVVRSLFLEALGNLNRRRMQAALSAFGIATGIAAVVLLVALVSGLHRMALSTINAAGGNVVQVRVDTDPSTADPKGFPLTLRPEDAEVLLRTTGYFDLAVAENSANTVVRGVVVQSRSFVQTAGGGFAMRNTPRAPSVQLRGVTSSGFELLNLRLASGRLPLVEEFEGGARVAVLGARIARQVFTNRDPIGEILVLGDWTFRVVGVLEYIGEPDPEGAEPHISFVTAGIAVSILILVGVVAGVGPARRAAAVFPSEALRAE